MRRANVQAGTTFILAALACSSGAQTILFDFDNAPLYSPLPISLTVGSVTAHFTATGQGYSLQGVSTAPVVPAGFTGHFIYPSSVFASDLLVSFSQPLLDFSIQYAPQELACDSSATMKVTAYLGQNVVGAATTNATPGTWPVQTLEFNTGQPFDNVVVHYDNPPVTGGDYSPIFIADNMKIVPAPAPPTLSAITASNAWLQLTCTNLPGLNYSVLISTNAGLALPLWTVIGTCTESSRGQYQFADRIATNGAARFYRLREP